MPSRRRVANKNLANNLAEVQRRLRTLERRPVRSKLGNRSVTGTAISPNSVDGTQVSFGINLVAQVDPVSGDPIAILNPQDGQQVFDPSSGTNLTYSEEYSTYVPSTSTDIVAQSIATNANTAATSAQYTSNQALTTAGNKNRIFYAASESALNTQASASGYTIQDGDLWFDTANDYKMSKRSGGAWGAFQLGDLAVSAISAGKITAGQIYLSQGITIVATLGSGSYSSLTIDNSGIAAVNNSNVQTFSINSNGDAFFGGNLTAGIQITAPIITGGTLRTSSGLDSSSFRRVEITDSDDVIFYNSSSRVGTITSIDSTWANSGIGDNPDPYSLSSGIMIYGGNSSVSNGSTTYPSIVAAGNTVYMYGDGANRISASTNLTGIYGMETQIYPDVITMWSGYGTTSTGLKNGTILRGRLALQYTDNSEGPLLSGTGTPTTSGVIDGQIIFRYS